MATHQIVTWSVEIFVIKKVKNNVPWAYVVRNLQGEEILGNFYEKKVVEDKSKRDKNWKSNQEKKQLTVRQIKRLW